MAAPAARSLRWRLLAATLAAVAVALVLAGLVLHGLFRDHVRQQFVGALTQQLDQVTARLAFDAAGRPSVDARLLSDPRWERPYSGLYWQLEPAAPGPGNAAVLRSRSLWDARLRLPTDRPPDGQVHEHEAIGPGGEPLRVVERTVQSADDPAQSRWRLAVAADESPMRRALAGFSRVLAGSLVALFALLVAAAWAQVAVGLQPLRALQASLRRLRSGLAPTLAGRFPAEIQPLVDDFNAVLAHDAERVARARAQAGNLAHALKTPLAVLEQLAAAPAPPPDWREQVRAQVALARRQVDWQLARARMTASAGRPGQRCAVEPVLRGLLRVMGKVHAERDLRFTLALAPDIPDFAGEEHALQEILGNLLDNACKWARSEVRVSATAAAGSWLEITIEEDGPGIAPAQWQRVLERGVRLDDSVPGSGLGLAIAQEAVQIHGGQLTLQNREPAGLRAGVRLPALRVSAQAA